MLDDFVSFVIEHQPSEWRAYGEALVSDEPARRAAEVEGLGVVPTRALLAAIARRHRALLEQLPAYSSEPAVVLGVAQALAEHVAEVQQIALAAEEQDVRERMARRVHEMRSPLMGIFGALSVLQPEGETDPAPGASMLAMIARSADRLAAAIDELVPSAPLALVCDPDGAIREILKRYLGHAGYEVATCATGEELARLTAGRQVAVALAEASQVASARAALAGLRVPLVVLGRPGPGEEANWLPKPFKKADVLEAVRRVREAPSGVRAP